VRYRHKLGQSWSIKYGVVCSLEVRDDEVDIVDTKVVGGAELDCQCDLSQRLRGLPWEHSLERCVVRLEVFWINV
jgi:hypothetical protein